MVSARPACRDGSGSNLSTEFARANWFRIDFDAQSNRTYNTNHTDADFHHDFTCWWPNSHVATPLVIEIGSRIRSRHVPKPIFQEKPSKNIKKCNSAEISSPFVVISLFGGQFHMLPHRSRSKVGRRFESATSQTPMSLQNLQNHQKISEMIQNNRKTTKNCLKPLKTVKSKRKR